MSTGVFATYSRDAEEGSDDLNNNSFLMRSGKFADDQSCGSPKETVADEEIKTEPNEEINAEANQNEDLDSHRDIEVSSINMEDNFEKSEPNSIGQYSCHLCSFVCIRKNDFQEHLLTHYTYSCSQCDYASRTEGRLKRHVKDFHCSNSPENFSGQKVASNNPKSLKCKHCGLISSTKEKHWSHQRTHLDVTKCLQCPKCPFITEYKHHLEYHIRNHDKIKPYKCSKCQYRCVNKSMLNSHKKSHSNVYQFRCADCSYASKYCHSLKQHLTRHGHQPAPVLNEDGSLPTYDNSNEILSMKRGPNNRSLSSQNSVNGHADTTFVSSPLVPASVPRHDISLAPASAFSTFKKDQMDSILNWTLKQCYQIPLSRFLPTQYPIMPPIPSLMSLSAMQAGSRDITTQHHTYQSSALDLSVKSPPHTTIKDAQRLPQNHQCAICHLQFCDQQLLDIHLLYHGRFNNFPCSKCGTLYNNAFDFFAHFSQSCRD